MIVGNEILTIQYPPHVSHSCYVVIDIDTAIVILIAIAIAIVIDCPDSNVVRLVSITVDGSKLVSR